MKRGDTKAGMKANIRYFIKWSALALVIGSVAGAAGTIFSMGVSWATGFRLSHPSMLFFLPVSGLLIVWMYTPSMRKETGEPIWLLMQFPPMNG